MCRIEINVKEVLIESGGREPRVSPMVVFGRNCPFDIMLDALSTLPTERGTECSRKDEH